MFLKKQLKADILEIKDLRNRKGIIGYLMSCRDAAKKLLTEISYKKTNFNKYKIIAIGTPIWAWNITPAIRTFLKQNKLKNKLAFFCTMGGSGYKTAFKEMQKLSKKPFGTLALKSIEMKSKYKIKSKHFVELLKWHSR